MISQASGSAVFNAYSNNSNESKEITQKANVTKQGDMSKVERIKISFESGEYNMNLHALSQKIAEDLL